MHYFTSSIIRMIIALGLAVATPAVSEDSLDCSIFSKEGYAEYSARIEKGLSTIEVVENVIITQIAGEIRQHIIDNIDERMERHAGRSDQEYWMKSEIGDLCRWESQRVFEELLLEHGAEPPGEVDRAIMVMAYPHPKLNNDLQPLAALWRIQKKLECSGILADALSMRSREFENAYNRSKCPLKIK